MKYEIFRGDNGKYVFSWGKWGFYNTSWTGNTQVRIDDPNERMVIKFDSEEECRKTAEEITEVYKTVWTKI